jgi:hypothetical protein
MGLLLDDAELLSEISLSGVSFRQVLTLGKQQLFFHPAEFLALKISHRFSKDRLDQFLSTAVHEGTSEPLFRLLGAEKIDAMDFSDYEGAEIVHDLNQPISSELKEKYDVVLDGGTLEHVFNFPVAIRNAMELVKVGGTLMLLTPANNQLGHGFYQFSPELFYNVLSPANGYRVEQMTAIELSPAHLKFKVADPQIVKERVTLTNSWPVNLFVQAKRLNRAEIFRQTPQQTDYSRRWEGSATGLPEKLASAPHPAARSDQMITFKKILKGKILHWAPALVRGGADFKQWLMNRQHGFNNKNHFQRKEVD